VINKIEISVDCKEFISQCLTKKADQRLGYNGGVEEILKHEWFEGVDIEAIKNKTMPAMYKPQLSDDPLDVQNFDPQFTEVEARHSVLENDDIKTI
jgi:hypothetical protein